MIKGDGKYWDYPKYIPKINPNVSYQLSYSYSEYIVNASELYTKIDVALITSVIKQESHFSNNAVSDAYAYGLMGILEETGKVDM